MEITYKTNTSNFLREKNKYIGELSAGICIA